MRKYFLVYNSGTNLDVNLLIVARPSKPSPVMEYETVKVPGGKTLYREKGYSDIEIPVSFNFISKHPNLWDKDWRSIKRWLLSSGDGILKFCDDLEVFYKVNKVTIETPTRDMKRLGKFNVIFTCDPYTYFNTEEEELNNLVNNQYEVSRPVYRIVGNGELSLTVNNKLIKVNVGQELIINTDLGLTYREGIINNTSLTGNYEDLYLQEGENTFEWTENFRIFITPNWRCV